MKKGNLDSSRTGNSEVIFLFFFFSRDHTFSLFSLRVGNPFVQRLSSDVR